MKTVLQLTSNYVDAFYAELFASVKEQGFENVVFVPQKKNFDDCQNAPKEVIKVQCYSYLDRFFLGSKSNKIVDAIKEKVDMSKIDIIHAHSLYTCGVPAYKLFKEFGIPYVISVRFNDIDTFAKIHIFNDSLLKETLKNAKGIIYITPLIQKKALKRFKFLNDEEFKNKSCIIPNKISDVFLEKDLEPKEKPTGNINVLFVGTMITRKRLDLLAERCSKVFKDGDTLSVISSSQTPPTELMNKYPFIKYIGKINHFELPKYYREADIFALLSTNETFGISYIEAMSQGVPVMYSRNQAIDGMYEDGVVGYGVIPNDEKDFIEKYSLILNNYKNISKNCIKHSFDFKSDKIVNSLISVYNKE